MSERWKVGDKIDNRYEIDQILRGGMGVVYICYDHEERVPLALKTFQDSFLQSQDIRDRFIREAETWVGLEKHQNIVRAFFVKNIQSKPYIFLEYIANPEMGGADLGRWIRHGLEVLQVLNFAVQICDGLDYGHKKVGMVHRDIKPGNILVTQDRVVKITDFGLVKTHFEEASVKDFLETAAEETFPEGVSFTQTGEFMGSAPYMSPEQCRNPRDIDIRSDIYAFGAVLYEMLTGQWIFEADTSEAFVRCHLHEPPTSPGSIVPGLSKDLEAVVLRCLAKDPGERYPSFAVVREELARIYHGLTGEDVAPAASGEALVTEEWTNKGISLSVLGRYEEGIECFNRALGIDPGNAKAWYNKGYSLSALGRHEKAIECCDRALDIDPGDAKAWICKGATLSALGRRGEVIEHFDHALDIDPGNAKAWYNKGIVLYTLGRHEEGIECFNRALDIDSGYADAWCMKGSSLSDLGHHEEAIECFDHALNINPRVAIVWTNKGATFSDLGRHEEAIKCYDHALDIDSGNAKVWSNKGISLYALGRRKDAIECYERALNIDPGNANAWFSIGAIFANYGRVQEALGCFTKALEVDPHNKSIMQAIAQCQQYLKQG